MIFPARVLYSSGLLWRFSRNGKSNGQHALDTIMDFSKYGITDYCVYQQAISVELSEIIAVRADDTDGVKAALQSRKRQPYKAIRNISGAGKKIVKQDGGIPKGDLCFLIASEEPEKARESNIGQNRVQTLLIRGIKKTAIF